LPLFADGYDLAGWRIRHGDQPSADEKSVSGHWHPAVRWKGRKVPCFLARGQHLILPAFSLDAAGVDVRSDARWRDWDCYAVCGTGIAGLPINAGA
jgi:metallophosphoesterase superfamily enzyme